MPREYLVSLYALIATVGFVAIGFAFPPIIEREGWVSPTARTQSETKGEVALKREQHAFCRDNLDDVNCACFARKAGHILAQPRPEYYGYVRTDPSDLARGRGQHNC